MKKYEFHLTVEPAARFPSLFPAQDPWVDSVQSATTKLGLKLYHIANYSEIGTEINREFITGHRQQVASDDKARSLLTILARRVNAAGLYVVRTKLEAPITQSLDDHREVYCEEHFKLLFPQGLTAVELSGICSRARERGYSVSERLEGTKPVNHRPLLLTRRWASGDAFHVHSENQLRELFPEAEIAECDREVCLWDSAEWIDADWIA